DLPGCLDALVSRDLAGLRLRVAQGLCDPGASRGARVSRGMPLAPSIVHAGQGNDRLGARGVRGRSWPRRVSAAGYNRGRSTADPPMSQFVHLRVHTEYSLIDSVVRVPRRLDATASAGMPAIALTDETNLFAMVKFYRAAQARGLKPVVGIDVRLRDPSDRQEPARLTLLSQNLAGYHNLTQLITRAYLEGQRRGTPLVDRNWLTATSTVGLIALSGAQDGDIGRALLANRGDDARRFLGRWLEVFDNRFYV